VPNTWSQESWAVVRDWLWECTSKHGPCSLISSESNERRLPTRLIEVCDTDRVRLRTVKTIRNFHSIQYLALSHCWGYGTRFTLNSDSESMLCEGIGTSSLPKTFQDAILVTTRFRDLFGIRYLWIDSLCIFQDSVADWRHESAIMGEIYQNAFCTLAATAAEDGDGGLFFDRDPQRKSYCAIPVAPKRNEMSYFYCVDHEDWAKNVSKSPLYRRSWVLQERLLSRRIIHFTADQLYWECSGLEASEEFPNGFPDGFGQSFKNLLPFTGLPKIEEFGPLTRGSYGLWDQIVKVYSAGKLTKETDRLVALSGIAHKLQKLVIPNDTYLAGLWKHDLPFELLWDVEEPRTPHSCEDYVAPTWSWASRIGSVPCERDIWASATSLVDIINSVVLPVDDDHMGQVRGGYIRMSGMLIRGRLSRKYQPGSPNPGISLEFLEGTIHGAICRPDEGFSSTVPLPSVIYCLPILHTQSRYSSRTHKGLLLVPSGNEGEFKRYGTFTASTFQNESPTLHTPSRAQTWPLGSNGRCEFTIV
jgi:Heterokaryon incompatibility protein (HET)